MDWRANSASRSRSRAANGRQRLDLDSLDHAERHSHALLANLEEVQESPTTMAPSDMLSTGPSGGMYLPLDHSGRTDTPNLHPGAPGGSVATAVSMPIAASAGSTAQSLLSMRFQGFQQGSVPSPTSPLPSSKADEGSAARLMQSQDFQTFHPPNAFQHGSDESMFVASPLPAFPPMDPFASGAYSLTSNPAFQHRVMSHDQIGPNVSGGASSRRVRKTSFDHTVARVGTGNEASGFDGLLSLPAMPTSSLSPVQSSTSLVSSKSFDSQKHALY
jgi:hypothetical protein